jgi:hypothetical protein
MFDDLNTRRLALRRVFQTGVVAATLGLFGRSAHAATQLPVDPAWPTQNMWLARGKANPKLYGDFLVQIGQGMQRDNLEGAAIQFLQANGANMQVGKAKPGWWKKAVAAVLRAIADLLDPPK